MRFARRPLSRTAEWRFGRLARVRARPSNPNAGRAGAPLPLRQNKKGSRGSPFCFVLAERVGFEPTVRSPVRLISSQVHSTTLPPLLVTGRLRRERPYYRRGLRMSQGYCFVGAGGWACGLFGATAFCASCGSCLISQRLVWYHCGMRFARCPPFGGQQMGDSGGSRKYARALRIPTRGAQAPRSLFVNRKMQKGLPDGSPFLIWRRGWDSNPRYARAYA